MVITAAVGRQMDYGLDYEHRSFQRCAICAFAVRFKPFCRRACYFYPPYMSHRRTRRFFAVC